MTGDALLMDGDCGLCTHTAVFLHPKLRDKQSIHFLAIESEEGQAMISNFPIKHQQADSVYLLRNGRSYIRSGAAIRGLLYLKWYYAMWFPVLWLVPSPLRDIVYRIIARYRHKVFKRPAMCVFPI